MALLRTLVLLIGFLAVMMGLLWIGQGLNIIRWPVSSFMLGRPVWSVNGTVLAALGALAIWWSRRRRA